MTHSMFQPAFGPAAQRGAPAVHDLFASVASTLAAQPLTAEIRIDLLDWEGARQRVAEWSNLIRRALEPNVFLEPDFALTLAQHMPPAHRPVFLFVTKRHADPRRDLLIAIFVLNAGAAGVGLIARAWQPNLMALGTPLIDTQCGGETVDALFDWLARQRGSAAMLFLSLPAEGPVARLLHARQTSRGVGVRPFNGHMRAVLKNQTDTDVSWHGHASVKHQKELRRQHRRLAECGELTWTSAADPTEVRRAFETFLTLEASGWKGRRGAALLRDPGLAAFSRVMTRSMARSQSCRIDALELNRQPVAMGVVLNSGRHSALWKIAYDETYAAYSPGVQFIREFTLRQARDTHIEITDSCAQPDHSMIDRLWPDRLPITDLFAQTASNRSGAFVQAGAREALRRRGFSLAKSMYHATLGKRTNQIRASDAR